MPTNTFTVVNDDDDQQWEVYADNDCHDGPGMVHLVTIHEPLSCNPGWEFHLTFGLRGINAAIHMYKQVKGYHDHENLPYVAGSKHVDWRPSCIRGDNPDMSG